MSEDDGQEDKLIHRIIDEAVKNIFTLHFDLRELRPIVEYFESGQSIEVGDSLPSKTVLERIAKVPGLKKRADELAGSCCLNSPSGEGREAATASAAEFILEGLHVHNKLNKSAKDGASSPIAAENDRGTRSCRFLNTRSGTARSSSSPSRPTRSSISSPNHSPARRPRSAQHGRPRGRDARDRRADPERRPDREGRGGTMAGHPAGLRRIQDRSLDDLFQTFRRDSLGRHDTQEKGEGTVPLEDTRPYVYGDSLANLDLHETIKNAYIRQGGGVPIRL